jgi:Tfp pilus assembly protein PilX
MTKHDTLRFRRMRHQRGAALMVGLIFLVMLSLVAIIAMRGTLLEMNLVNATAKHEQAFETSEAARAVPLALFDQHVFYRGWPTTWGGAIAITDFNPAVTFANTPLWLTKMDPANGGLQTKCGSPMNFYTDPTCVTRTAGYYYDPSLWDTDVVLTTCTTTSDTCTTDQQAVTKIAIVKDGSVVSAGAGGAQAQGYSSKGVGSATGGGSMIFQIKSASVVPGGGTATTITQYNQVIK